MASAVIDQPFRPIQNQNAELPKDQLIPPIVYQTWEENFFGRRHKNSLEEFRRKNDDLSFVLMDRQARDSYMKNSWGEHPIYAAYTGAIFGAMRADIFRYCILFDLGGYYFDISKGVDCSLTGLHDSSASALISFEGNDFLGSENAATSPSMLRQDKLVLQWGFGFEPRHPILRKIIERIVSTSGEFRNVTFRNPKEAILRFTGPVAFTFAVREAFEEGLGRGVAQLDVDFMGHGIYSLRGSGARHQKHPSYAEVENSPILVMVQ